MVSRRRFLTNGLGACLSVSAGRYGFAASPEVLRLSATQAQASFRKDHSAKVWAYNNSVPGPLIRARQGDELAVLLQNRLDEPTSLHWHGIRIINAMDGVPGLTQPAVQPGDDYEYRFIVPDAGTYWYHSHFNSPEQVGRGLAGMLVVQETEPYAVDHELLLVVDDWRLDQEGEIAGNFAAMQDISHEGRLGNIITINGQINPDLQVEQGARVRIRMLNSANSRIMPLSFSNHEVTVIALDGQPVSPFRAEDGRMTLAPGQRADVVIDMKGGPGSRHPINFYHRNGVVEVAYLAYNSVHNTGKMRGDVLPLDENPLKKVLDLDSPITAVLNMEGGAMGGMREASYKGKTMGMRELVNQGMVWAFNGIAGRPDEPLLKANLGQTVLIDIFNNNSWPHAMHLHGHHFTVIERNGNPINQHPWHDTLLMEASEKVRIAFVADNPGSWLIHCHMLEHQMGGMITWLEVA